MLTRQSLQAAALPHCITMVVPHNSAQPENFPPHSSDLNKYSPIIVQGLYQGFLSLHPHQILCNAQMQSPYPPQGSTHPKESNLGQSSEGNKTHQLINETKSSRT